MLNGDPAGLFQQNIFDKASSWVLAKTHADTHSLYFGIGQAEANLITFAAGGEAIDALRGAGLAARAAEDESSFVNLASESRTEHILSGHMPPGEPGNSLFPSDWSAGKIMNGVSEVATDPANQWVQQTGRLGAEFTRAGDPVRFAVEGVYDSLKNARDRRGGRRGHHHGIPGAMSGYLAPEEITRRLHLVMDAANDLPLRDVEQVEGLIQVGERGVAFENLCTQIYEYDIRLPSDLRDTFASIGEQLGVAARYWERLDFGG